MFAAYFYLPRNTMDNLPSLPSVETSVVKPEGKPTWDFPLTNAIQCSYSAGLSHTGLLNFQEFCELASKLLRV